MHSGVLARHSHPAVRNGSIRKYARHVIDEDMLDAVAEPRCPSCATVLHQHPRGWWCRGCDIEYRQERIAWAPDDDAEIER